MTQGPPEFRITSDEVEGVAVVRVAGELDIHTQEQLVEVLGKVTNGGSSVVVDLEGCEFIDSSGLRALLLGARETGGKLAIAAPGPQVTRILEMTGMGKAVPVHESVEAALKSLG